MRSNKVHTNQLQPAFHPAFPGASSAAVELNETRHKRGANRIAKASPWKRILVTLETWNERRRQRQNLVNLPDRLLRDIGIDRVEALREARKPFWRF